ncbi:MAG: hypothetical protein IT361_12120 [Gemmatimonadaceae bacterium]|nr:hypothetical protein [Gemmatimonadaceae bacterium]
MPRTSPMWTIVNDFHIEKVRVPVVVITTSGERIEGDLFAQANTRTESGHERATDVVNTADAWFPIANAAGRVLLCSKARVRVMHVSGGEVDTSAWSLGTPAQVVVVLDDGQQVSGTILIEMESARQRVLDFLNRLPLRFLPIHTSGGVVLVNRDNIVHVEQVS